ncbi:MAG: oligosaccharide flippase family protein [Actinomycetota bacterium]|nr:oligosaccharide flippase family protein [Actinomycetota bacterium]
MRAARETGADTPAPDDGRIGSTPEEEVAGRRPSTPEGVGSPAAETMTSEDVRRRAAAGAALIAARGVGVQVLAAVGSVVLARLLLPRDFGTVAFGLTLATTLGVVLGPGMGAALIRRPEPPEPADLEALLALQLAVTAGVAALVAAVALPFGEVGRVTAVMMIALPIAALRTPGVIAVERRLSFRPVVLVEVVEAVCFYAWAVVTVAIGWGVWGIATAGVARAAVGSGLMIAIAPVRLPRPRFLWARIRGLVAFGARIQAFDLLGIARDQAVNVGVAAVGGLAVLGLWNLANRLLQLPFLLFASLWRVSFPAMSRLLAAGEDPRPIIERAVVLVAVGTGVLLAPLVGAAPALVPSVLGAKWEEAADVVPWASLGLMVGGPVSVAVAGYLWAVGDASTPLRALVIQGVTWIAIALPLLPIVGVAAVGLGWLAASVTEAAILARRASRRTGARILSALVVPTAVAAVAGAAGWATAASAGTNLAAAALGGIVAAAVYLITLLVVRRSVLVDALGVTGHALRGAVARPQ